MPFQFPGGAQKVFEDTLIALPGNTPFEKLREYNRRLGSQNKTCPHRITIDDRIEHNLFYLFPGEFPDNDRNCFENTTRLYFALQQLYPQSNPQLIELNEGKRGRHAAVLFTHQGRIYAGDPNYKMFYPARLEPSRLIAFPLNGQPAKETEFREAVHIPPENLERTIAQLRTPSGLLDFLKESGQLIVRDTTGLKPYDIFFNMVGDKLTSELRITDFILNPSFALRKTLDYSTLTAVSELLAYRQDSWAALKDVVVLGRTKTWQIGGKGLPLTEFTTLEELERRKMDGALLKSKNYNGMICIIARKRHKSKADTTLSNRAGLEDLRRRSRGDPFYHFAKKHSPAFVNHVTDAYYLPPLSKGEDKKIVTHRTWRALRRKEKMSAKKLVILTLHTLRSTMREQIKEQRRYERIVKERYIAVHGNPDDKL